MTTSAVSCLVPQYPLQVSGPGFLHLQAGRLQSVGVLMFPPADPDLKTQTAHTGVLGHPNIVCLANKTKSKRKTKIINFRTSYEHNLFIVSMTLI